MRRTGSPASPRISKRASLQRERRHRYGAALPKPSSKPLSPRFPRPWGEAFVSWWSSRSKKKIADLEQKQLKLGGTWKAGERYAENTLVSFQGGLWLSRAANRHAARVWLTRLAPMREEGRCRMRRQPTYEEVTAALETPSGKRYLAKLQELADHQPQLSDEEIVRRLNLWFEEQGWRPRRRLH